MSDRFRKLIGALFLLLACILFIISFLPLKKLKMKTYTVHGNRNVPIIPISHLLPENLANQGNADQLTILPGIGPSIAQEILLERKENGFFYYPEDLISVKGIGEKKLEQIQLMLTETTGESEE